MSPTDPRMLSSLRAIYQLPSRGGLMTDVALAGVAIGSPLQARRIFPKNAEVIATVILGSVLINEILGPKRQE
jgi:hypothetical protein